MRNPNIDRIERIDFNKYLNFIAEDSFVGQGKLLNIENKVARRAAEAIDEFIAVDDNGDGDEEVIEVIERNWDDIKGETEYIATFFNYWAERVEQMIAQSCDMLETISIFTQRVIGECFSTCCMHLPKLLFQLVVGQPLTSPTEREHMDRFQKGLHHLRDVLIKNYRIMQFDSFHNIILHKRSQDVKEDIKKNEIQLEQLKEKKPLAAEKILEMEKQHAWLLSDEFVKDLHKNKHARKPLDQLSQAKAKKSEIMAELVKTDALAQMAKVRITFTKIKQYFEIITKDLVKNCTIKFDPMCDDQFFAGCGAKVFPHDKSLDSTNPLKPDQLLFLAVSLKHCMLKMNEPNIVVFHGMDVYPVSKTCLTSQFILVPDNKLRYDVWC